MTKKELRLALRAEREAIDPVQREKYQDMILIQFNRLHFPFIQYLHTYLPMEGRNEPDPDTLVRVLEFRNPGLQVAVPKIAGEEMLHIIVGDSTTWVTNQMGIAEPMEGEAMPPEAFDLVFVPLLGFDRSGNRIGYGKGYYDRFLAQCHSDVIKVGLSFLEPVGDIEPDPWDIPLDYCITPQQVYEF
jgi:5-formyltetrahydrofolate cyclo-ligase